jgi:hypothetical protein
LLKKVGAFFRFDKGSLPGTSGSRIRHFVKSRLFVYCILLVIHIAIALFFLTDREPATDAALTGFPLDDAWIHLVYGRSIAHTGAPYYNSGELEAGFTSPVWIGVLGAAEVAAGVLPVSVILLIKILGLICAWLTSIGIYELCRRLLSSRAVALLAGMLVAAYPWLAFAQLSGMEVCLATGLTVWALVMWLDGRLWHAGTLLAFSYITRPETAILAAVVAVTHFLVGFRRGLAERSREGYRLVSPLFVAAISWSAYCLFVSGHPLPNTFYAKFADTAAATWLGNILDKIVLPMPVMFLFAGAIAYALGAYSLWRRQRSMALAILIYPWLFLLGIGSTREMPSMCGSYFYWIRYTLPAIPLLIVPMAAGVGFVWQSQWVRNGNVARAFQALAVMLALGLVFKYPSEISSLRSQYAWNCQNINEVQVEFGKWVKRNLPRNAVVLANDAGAMRYFGEHKTIDLVGLNDQSLLFNRGLQSSIMQDAQALENFMRSQGANYFIVLPTWYPALINSEGFRKHFAVVNQFESKNFTLTSFPQSTMIAFALRHS